jgi:hypothetical protein
MIPPLVMNESSKIERAGAIDVFRTVADLEHYVEPWYVNEPHFIFDCQGLQLEIEPQGNNVHLKAKIPHSFKPEIVRYYFA